MASRHSKLDELQGPNLHVADIAGGLGPSEGRPGNADSEDSGRDEALLAAEPRDQSVMN